MLTNIKALVVVLFFATVIFTLAKPACLRFMSEEDFRRRRAVWYIISVAAFASPSVWLYLLIAIPVAVWAGIKDSNPAAMAVLIGSAAPAFLKEVPHLFPVNQGMIVTLCVVIPALVRQAMIKHHAVVGESRLQ